MPAPFDVRGAGGGSPSDLSIDAQGNLGIAGNLTTGGAIYLGKLSSAPPPVPGELALYSPDGVNLTLVGAGGQSAGINNNIAVYSRQLSIWANGTASSLVATVGTWTPTYIANAVYYGWVNQSDGTQNDAISFDFACGAGTYQLDLYHLAFSSRGIYTVKIDGATVGTVDGYTAGGLTPEIGSITGIVLTQGTHTVTLLMATKNAASAGFVAQAEHILMTRTA